MNFLGIGPGELILIFILLLVVVGPERLPELARQLGRWVVRARNWLQTSPDAAMVLRARQEIEQELAQLKSSLLEVQSVRDEVLGAARQFNEAVSPLTSPRTSLGELINGSNEIAQAGANGQGVSQPMIADEPAAPADGAQTAPTPGDSRTAPTIADSRTAPASEIEDIRLGIQAVMADLYALQEQLKQRGAIDPDWQPPSFTMQLPTPQPDAHIEEADG